MSRRKHKMPYGYDYPGCSPMEYGYMPMDPGMYRVPDTFSGMPGLHGMEGMNECSHELMHDMHRMITEMYNMIKEVHHHMSKMEEMHEHMKKMDELMHQMHEMLRKMAGLPHLPKG